MINALFVAALTLSVTSCSSGNTQMAASDLAAFQQRREACDHFRGEEPTDAHRVDEINTGVRKFCRGTDKELRNLKEKYRNDKEAMVALSEYDNKVEE